MKKDKYIVIILVVLSVMVVQWGCTNEKEKAAERLMSLLPTEKGVPGWAMVDSAEVYDKEGLWEYIDGGAELYLKYGFKHVITSEYADTFDTHILLEIFEMNNASAAAGIYADKADDSTSIAGLGDRSSIQDYYLNFIRGPYLVTLTGYEENYRNLDGLIKIAANVDDLIKKSL
ncbi:MAG: DUF6599 family protein [Candidatus Zixiibacteriota bacterium]